MEELLKRAVSGDAEAQYQLALSYLAGRGAPLSLAEGIRWVESAARARHHRARSLLDQLRATALQGVSRADEDQVLESRGTRD